jgi:beta-glucosidase
VSGKVPRAACGDPQVARTGADVPQFYLTEAAGERRMRLLGFEGVELRAGESLQFTLTADPRLLARFDGGAGRWRITEGIYKVAVGKSADSWSLEAQTILAEALFGS